MTASPAPITRILPLAWLMSRAFSSRRFTAILAFPTVVASLLPYIAQGVIYESDDRDGMVIIGKRNIGRDIAFALPIAFVIGSAAAVSLALIPFLGGVYAVTVVVMFVLLAWGAGQFIRPASFSAAVDKETPPGERWAVQSLAQRPGTQYSALLLTRSIIRSLPAGRVVVAVAGSEKLARGYERLGFTRGNGPRLHLVTG